jgi:hypothetical protein
MKLHTQVETKGKNVMLTIFSDFWLSSTVKIGVYLKNQCNDPIFSRFSSALSQKRQFAANFSAKYVRKPN